MVTFSTSQLMPKNRGPLAKFHSEPIVSFYWISFIGNTFIDQQPLWMRSSNVQNSLQRRYPPWREFCLGWLLSRHFTSTSSERVWPCGFKLLSMPSNWPLCFNRGLTKHFPPFQHKIYGASCHVATLMIAKAKETQIIQWKHENKSFGLLSFLTAGPVFVCWSRVF